MSENIGGIVFDQRPKRDWKSLGATVSADTADKLAVGHEVNIPGVGAGIVTSMSLVRGEGDSPLTTRVRIDREANMKETISDRLEDAFHELSSAWRMAENRIMRDADREKVTDLITEIVDSVEDLQEIVRPIEREIEAMNKELERSQEAGAGARTDESVRSDAPSHGR